MDMTKYAGSTFIKVEDLAGGSLRKTIADVEEGKFEKPVATFRDGPKLSLNKTNVRTLIRAFGEDSSDWIDQLVELYAGTVSDKNGEPMPSACWCGPSRRRLRQRQYQGRSRRMVRWMTKYLLTEEARAREARCEPALSPPCANEARASTPSPGSGSAHRRIATAAAFDGAGGHVRAGVRNSR